LDREPAYMYNFSVLRQDWLGKCLPNDMFCIKLDVKR